MKIWLVLEESIESQCGSNTTIEGAFASEKSARAKLKSYAEDPPKFWNVVSSSEDEVVAEVGKWTRVFWIEDVVVEDA